MINFHSGDLSKKIVFVENFPKFFFGENNPENFGLLALGCIPVALKIFEGKKMFDALKILEG